MSAHAHIHTFLHSYGSTRHKDKFHFIILYKGDWFTQSQDLHMYCQLATFITFVLIGPKDLPTLVVIVETASLISKTGMLSSYFVRNRASVYSATLQTHIF